MPRTKFARKRGVTNEGDSCLFIHNSVVRKNIDVLYKVKIVTNKQANNKRRHIDSHTKWINGFINCNKRQRNNPSELNGVLGTT